MFYFFFFFFFLPSSKDPSVHVHAGRVIVTNYPNDDTIKISRGLRGTGVFSLSEQTVSLYDPSLCRAYPVHRAGPDHLSIPLSLTEPPPHPRRVIGTRPQPPPLFNTPAPAYSTPATGELPPYIHQRGCIQPPLTRPPVLLPPTSSSAPLPSSLSLSLSLSLFLSFSFSYRFGAAASFVTSARSPSLALFPFHSVCLRVALSFRVNVNGARRVIHRSNTYSCPRLVHPPEIATKTGPLLLPGVRTGASPYEAMPENRRHGVGHRSQRDGKCISRVDDWGRSFNRGVAACGSRPALFHRSRSRREKPWLVRVFRFRGTKLCLCSIWKTVATGNEPFVDCIR